MRRLGTAFSHSEEAGLIVEGEFPPEEGSKVVDASLEKIGVVSDVFGSVEAPFVAVRGGETGGLVGETLYVLKRGK